jgi:hypothetical protein
MKKIFILILCLALFTCLGITCFAEDTAAIDSADDSVDEATGEVDKEQLHTIFSRMWEFIGKYKGEMFTVIGDIALIAFALYMKIKNGKGAVEINAALNKIKQETGLSLSNQDNVVDVINKMIDSFNVLSAEYEKFKQTYEQYGATEVERNKVVGALSAQVATVLDILSTVYVNNRNLPQGVKDIINIKYANCLKALENDNALIGVVDAVHAALCGDVEVESESTEE